MSVNRRQFVETLAGLGGAALVADWSPKTLKTVEKWPIGCNVYTWYTFYGRANKDWFADYDVSFAEYVKAGFTTYEPSPSSPEEVIKLLPFIKKYKLGVPSVYVGGTAHKPEEGEKFVQNALNIADKLKPLGTKLIITNPSPIRWGGTDNKTDEELTEQAKNLNKLGAALRQRGITLAYHTHDSEMRAGAREFHHMLQAVSPENMKFCMDVHWVYRGSGNSQLAVFDTLKIYGKRIAELHIRQSVNGVWSEVFGEGDIDYRRLALEIKKLGIRPHLVLEQCLEDKSPNTISPVEASQKSLANAKQVFAPLLD